MRAVLQAGERGMLHSMIDPVFLACRARNFVSSSRMAEGDNGDASAALFAEGDRSSAMFFVTLWSAVHAGLESNPIEQAIHG